MDCSVFFFQGFLFVAKVAIINRKDVEEWAIDLREDLAKYGYIIQR
jgi:hypothetical protein